MTDDNSLTDDDFSITDSEKIEIRNNENDDAESSYDSLMDDSFTNEDEIILDTKFDENDSYYELSDSMEDNGISYNVPKFVPEIPVVEDNEPTITPCTPEKCDRELINTLQTKSEEKPYEKSIILDFYQTEKRLILPPGKHNIVYLIENSAYKYDSVFKIGMTTRTMYKRFSEYPGGSKIIKYSELKYIPCKSMEKILLYMFQSIYIFKRNLGLEYFKGDINDMIFKFTELLKIFDIPELAGYSSSYPVHRFYVESYAGIPINIDSIKKRITT